MPTNSLGETLAGLHDQHIAMLHDVMIQAPVDEGSLTAYNVFMSALDVECKKRFSTNLLNFQEEVRKLVVRRMARIRGEKGDQSG